MNILLYVSVAFFALGVMSIASTVVLLKKFKKQYGDQFSEYIEHVAD